MTTPPDRRITSRTASSVVLAVVGCLLCVLSLLAVWGRNQVLDTDTYMASVTPLAHDPIIQAEVASKVSFAINSRLDADELARAALPERAAFLAKPLGDAVEDTVKDVTRDFTTSKAFAKLWTQLNLTGHRKLVSVLTGDDSDNVVVDDGRLTLDLSRVVEAVRDRLENVGLSVVSQIPPITLVVDVADAGGLEQAQRAVNLLDKVANVLPFIGLGLLVASVVLARRRVRALALNAAGLAIAMTAFGMVLAGGAGIAASQVPETVASGDAVHAYYGHLTSLLRHGAVTVGLVSVAVWVVATLWRPIRAMVASDGAQGLRDAAALVATLVPVALVTALLLSASPRIWPVVFLLVVSAAAWFSLRRLLPRADQPTSTASV